MCWTTHGIPSALTAESDIPILKVGVEEKNMMVSPYIKFLYELGKTYKTKIDPTYGARGLCRIYAGFHSYDPRELQLYREFWGVMVARGALIKEHYPAWMEIFEGYIPKGSTYYLNMNGELVSDGICITNKKIK